VAILTTVGQGPHAIPVSAVIRAGSDRVLVGLAEGRGSLARLRAEPRVTLSLVAEGIAVSAAGRARVIDEALVDGVVAVEIVVDAVRDHSRPTFELQEGVRWRWTDPAAAARDEAVRDALARLAGQGAGDDAG
jgi:hypothetical protein